MIWARSWCSWAALNGDGPRPSAGESEPEPSSAVPEPPAEPLEGPLDGTGLEACSELPRGDG